MAKQDDKVKKYGNASIALGYHGASSLSIIYRSCGPHHRADTYPKAFDTDWWLNDSYRIKVMWL